MSRSAIREMAFTLLYEIEIQKDTSKEHIELFLENSEVKDEETKEYIMDAINGINSNQEEISNTIAKNLKTDWAMDRISKINIALLKLAVYEIMYKKLPYKVVINEVVELAKKYGDDNSPFFINGILASIIKENERKKNET